MKVEIKNSLSEKQKILQNLVHYLLCISNRKEITSTRALVNFFPVPVYLLNHNLQKCLSAITAIEYLRIFIVLPLYK